MAFSDTFIQIYKDEDSEMWEFDHVGWQSPPESARFRMRADGNGVAVLVGRNNPSGELTWTQEERIWPSLDRAAAHVLDSYFFQDCLAVRDSDVVCEHRMF